MRPTFYSFIRYGKLFCNVGFRISHMYAAYTSFFPSSFFKILHANLSLSFPISFCISVSTASDSNWREQLILAPSFGGFGSWWHMSIVPTEARIVWSPRVIDNYEPQDLNAGNWPWCLWKRSKVLLIPKISLQHQA